MEGYETMKIVACYHAVWAIEIGDAQVVIG